MTNKYQQIMYSTNQYSENKLALVKKIDYPILEDVVHLRYFVINMNNEIVYLDQFEEKAIVKMINGEMTKINFSVIKFNDF